MTIINDINKVIEAYQKNYATLTITDLLNCQDKLSTLYYNFAEELQEAMLDYAQKYWNYKTQYAKSFLENIAKKIDQKITSKEAEELAKESTVTEWSEQMFASAYIEKLKLQDRAINKILSAIQQRISVLKQEYNITN